MTFRLTGLSPAPFRHLFGLPDARLAELGAVRHVSSETPGLPDRVSLRDVEVGGTALLVNHVHQPANNPYRASHAIFVREADAEPYDEVGLVPTSLRIRLLSLRAFDRHHMMTSADVVEGSDAAEALDRMLGGKEVDYVHVHYARQGCYAARAQLA